MYAGFTPRMPCPCFAPAGVLFTLEFPINFLSTLHFLVSPHHNIVSQYYIRNIMQLTNHLHIAFSFYRSLIMLAYVNSAQTLISSSSFRSGAWHKPSFACALTCGSGYGFCAPHPHFTHTMRN